jgi:hypothetical protein
MNPSIAFVPDEQFARANTCINQLRLPIMDDEFDLNLLDLSFCNEYFGQL